MRGMLIENRIRVHDRSKENVRKKSGFSGKASKKINFAKRDMYEKQFKAEENE